MRQQKEAGQSFKKLLKSRHISLSASRETGTPSKKMQSTSPIFLCLAVIACYLAAPGDATCNLAPACPCPAMLKPVCATNGVQYDNECVFNCKKNNCDGERSCK